MDTTLATAEAVMIAGVIASILQERLFGWLNGNAARIAAIALALVIGAVAVARVGGIAIGAPADNPIAFATEVLKVAIAVLVASQAAFRVITRPIATPTPIAAPPTP